MEGFCKYFAEEKPRYTLEEIAAKREKVIEMITKKVGKRITVDNIKTVMTPQLMMEMVDKIDEEFFENKLQRAFGASNCVLSACVENRCTNVAGRCHFSKGRDRCNRIVIKMMSKVFIDSFKNTKIKQRGVDNLKCNTILECFLLTFEHELTHAIVFCKCNEWDKTNNGAGDWTGITRPGNGHGKTFMSILFNVFGHTKFQHNLRDGMKVSEFGEKDYKLEDLAVGDKVIARFHFRGQNEVQEVLVVINDINRRRKVRNNIKVTVEDGHMKGDKFIINTHHIFKKIGDSDFEEPMPEAKKTPEAKQTQKKTASPKNKTVKKTAKPNSVTNTGCTKRNPAPPCKEGMEVRERPNGAKCCYVARTQQKGNKTQKKKKVTGKRTGSGCTKLNPQPPCAPGMFERERPNGALCCYKTKK
jgi:hypothetical protein